jgi:hypothetical protein
MIDTDDPLLTERTTALPFITVKARLRAGSELLFQQHTTNGADVGEPIRLQNPSARDTLPPVNEDLPPGSRATDDIASTWLM